MKCELNCKQDDANMIIKFSLFEFPKSIGVLFGFVAKENPKTCLLKKTYQIHTPFPRSKTKLTPSQLARGNLRPKNRPIRIASKTALISAHGQIWRKFIRTTHPDFEDHSVSAITTRADGLVSFAQGPKVPSGLPAHIRTGAPELDAAPMASESALANAC